MNMFKQVSGGFKRGAMILIAGAVMASVSMVAHAQQLLVAVGAPEGTYAKMFDQATAVCQQKIVLVQYKPATTGSVQNVELLMSNKVNAGIVQADVLFYRAMTDTRTASTVKTLFGLAPEEIHLIARADGVKDGGFLGFGGTRVIFNDLADLDGRNIGAVGGSVITANILAAQAGIKMNVINFNSNPEALQALQEKKIDAVVVVGGQPMPVVSALSSDYKLLSISDKFAEKLTAFYTKASLNYQNVGANGTPTLATQALFVTRDYRTPDMVEALTTFRSCVRSNLQTLQETLGNHEKWQDVKVGADGKWPLYDRKVGQ
jgi:TRAP-type uncharacterized transport system substrate-binding protein